MTQLRVIPGPKELDAVVADNIRCERVRRDWRQVDLADVLGWPPGAVCRLEIGQRRATVADLPKLCRALDISMADLLAGADPSDLEPLGLGGPPSAHSG